VSARGDASVVIGRRRFGWLTVVEQAGRTKGRAVLWRCQCVCGRESKATTAKLLSGKVTSCGCKRLLHQRRWPSYAVDHAEMWEAETELVA
jgi:hypothetical protein